VHGCQLILPSWQPLMLPPGKATHVLAGKPVQWVGLVLLGGVAELTQTVLATAEAANRPLETAGAERDWATGGASDRNHGHDMIIIISSSSSSSCRQCMLMEAYDCPLPL